MAKAKSQTSPGSTLMGTIVAISSSSITSCFSQSCAIGHDSSMISSITLDDALCSSERQQCRFETTIESFKEQKWAASPDNSKREEERLPCAKPQRKPFVDMSSSGTSLNHHHQTSTTCSSVDDYRSSIHNFVDPANFFLEEDNLDIDYFDLGDYGDETLEFSGGDF